jgi:hypothetical protein
MARRNRKRQQRDGFVTFRPVGLLIACATAVALAYVWLECRCEAVARDIQSLEQHKADLARKCRSEESRWVRMKSPGSIAQALAERGIHMDWPHSRQVIHLPASGQQRTVSEQEYWAEAGRAAPAGS